jgi:hypothetical protein
MPDRPVSSSHSNRAEIPESLAEEELLERLRARGGEVPELRQVRRWRPLLPTVPGVASGRRGRPPRRYPPAAVDWLEAIMEIRGGRKLPNYVLGFELWWRGFPVADPRPYVAAVLDAATKDAFAPGADPYSTADQLEELKTKTPRNTVYPLLAGRAGGDVDALISGLYAIVLLLFGVEPAWESTSALVGAEDRDEVSPRAAAEQVLGFERAASDEAPGGVRLLDEPIEIPGFFRELLGEEGFDARNLSKSVREAPDEELALALDDARAFSDDLVEFATAAEEAFGNDFAGLGFFTLQRREKENRFFRAGCVLSLLLLRRALGGTGIDQIKEDLSSNLVEFRAYNAVVDAFPEYAKYLRHDQQSRLATADPELIAKMRTDVAQFLAAHPELATALNIPE